jgi:hypothetical protein
VAKEEDIKGAAELLKTLLPIILNEKELKVIDEKQMPAQRAGEFEK